MQPNRGRNTVVQLDAYRARQDTLAPATCAAGEFISFRLGADEYAIDIQGVQEVRPYRGPMHVAGAPPFVKGVLDLDGATVTLVDLRLVFALERTGCDAYTAVIVVKLARGRIGIVVDSVRDVLALASDQIRPPPQVFGTEDTGLITGIGRVQARSLMLMDIAALMRNLGMDDLEDSWH